VMYFPSTHAWPTKHIPDTYLHGFTTRVSLWSPNFSTLCPDWCLYKRELPCRIG
jgi:hypothetical protein